MDRYEGEILNTDFHGYGVQTWYSTTSSISSSSSSGHENTNREGEVEEVYEGQFKDGKKAGFGTWRLYKVRGAAASGGSGGSGVLSRKRSSSSSSSSRYSSSNGDQDHDHGSSDHVYEGEWCDDKKHGRGVYIR